MSEPSFLAGKTRPVIRWGVPIVLGFSYDGVGKDDDDGVWATDLLISTTLFTAGALIETYRDYKKKGKRLGQTKNGGNSNTQKANNNNSGGKRNKAANRPVSTICHFSSHFSIIRRIS